MEPEQKPEKVKPNSSRVFIGSLGENITKEDVQTECSNYGSVKQVWLAVNPTRFALVDFGEVSEAEKAFEMLNGTEAFGSTKLQVNIVKFRDEDSEGEYEDDSDDDIEKEAENEPEKRKDESERKGAKKLPDIDDLLQKQ